MISICDRVVKVARSGRVGAIRKGSNPFECIFLDFQLIIINFFLFLMVPNIKTMSFYRRLLKTMMKAFDGDYTMFHK